MNERMIDNTKMQDPQSSENKSRRATVLQILPAMVTGGVERGTV